MKLVENISIVFSYMFDVKNPYLPIHIKTTKYIGRLCVATLSCIFGQSKKRKSISNNSEPFKSLTIGLTPRRRNRGVATAKVTTLHGIGAIMCPVLFSH